MATVNVKRAPTPPVDKIVLELSVREAQALQRLLYTGQWPENDKRTDGAGLPPWYKGLFLNQNLYHPLRAALVAAHVDLL